MSEQVDLIAQWFRAKEDMTRLQEIEKNLRLQIVGECFDNNIEKGTEHFALPDGYKLTCVKTENVNIDSEKLDKVLDSLSDGVAELLVKWTPSIQFSVFNGLPDEDKKIVQTCYQTKPGMPQLKLVNPKA